MAPDTILIGGSLDSAPLTTAKVVEFDRLRFIGGALIDAPWLDKWRASQRRAPSAVDDADTS